MSRQVGCTPPIPEIGVCRAGVLRVPAAFTPSPGRSPCVPLRAGGLRVAAPCPPVNILLVAS